VDPGDLVAGETLSILASCPTCEPGEALVWQVGDVDDVEPPSFVLGPVSGPQVSETSTVDALGVSRPVSYDIGATLPPVVDDSGPVLIRTAGDEGSLAIRRFEGDASEPIDIAFDAAAGRARRTCATVTATDVAGNTTTFDPPICADVGGDDDSGCTQQASPGLAACLLALLRRRRRRRAR
jgi:hypothetical protein